MDNFYDECRNENLLSVIAGPCVFESKDHSLEMALALKEACEDLSDVSGAPVNFIYKTSFDKANRTSAKSYRGPSFDEAYYGLQAVRQKGISVLTDVHEPWQCDALAADEFSGVADVLQIPAFLCRQTNLLQAAAEASVRTGCAVNVKKGQFLSPPEMIKVVEKLEYFGCKKIMMTERGTTFGYNNLVVDMRGLEYMYRNGLGYPVIMDCTRAVQSPGGMGDRSSGDRAMAPVIGRAAAAVGVAGVFMEVHNDPDNAPSDGPNMIKLDDFYHIMAEIILIDKISKRYRYLEEMRKETTLNKA